MGGLSLANLPELSKSPHGMMCIAQVDPSKALRWFIKRALLANHRDDPFYQQRKMVNPFLQSDRADYLLVEFWTGSEKAVKDYLAWLEERFDRECDRHLQMFGEFVL